MVLHFHLHRAARHLCAICAAVGDDAQDVQNYAAQALHAVGSAVPARLWLLLSLESARLPTATTTERTVALAALTDLVSGIGERQIVLRSCMLLAPWLSDICPLQWGCIKRSRVCCWHAMHTYLLPGNQIRTCRDQYPCELTNGSLCAVPRNHPKS